MLQVNKYTTVTTRDDEVLMVCEFARLVFSRVMLLGCDAVAEGKYSIGDLLNLRFFRIY